MSKKHRHQVALTFAVLFGGVHVLWSALVLFGWAQPLVNFVTWAHMLKETSIVGSFDVTAAATLIIVASAVGYGVGFIGATVWQRMRG